jgi:calcium-dependent protein kinase
VSTSEVERQDKEASARGSVSICDAEMVLSRRRLYMSEARFTCEHIEGVLAQAYDLGPQFAEGTFGVISKVVDKATRVERAVKTVRKRMMDESDLWHEIELMRKVDHPHILRSFCTYEEELDVHIVMECCDGGELFDLIEAKGCFEESVCMKVFSQMLLAVSYLHARNICHRDLKPENFLLVAEGPMEDAIVKLIDFGTARCFGPQAPMTTKICSIHYVAPEILSRRSDSYTHKCDCWSLGVCLYIMLCGALPFAAESDALLLKKVRKGKFKFEPEFFWDMVQEDSKNLISSLLILDDARLSAADALKHRWFSDLHAMGSCRKDLQRVVGRLSRFRSYPWFKQTSLALIAHELPQQRVEDLRRLFIEIDSTHRGKLRASDLARAIPADADDLRFNEDRDALLRDMEVDGATVDVSYTSFIAALIELDWCAETAACTSAFAALDLDNDGKIPMEDVSMLYRTRHLEGAVTQACQETLIEKDSRDQQEIQGLFQLYNVSQSGALTFGEFMNMLSST